MAVLKILSMTHHLTSPVSEEAIRDLKVGDQVLISGVVFTGRDAVHKYLHEEELSSDVNLEVALFITAAQLC